MSSAHPTAVSESVDESAPTTRCRILAVAERSFREIGYQKTTVADIAKTLKMSPANVYRFFESKKAINEAVVERVTGEIEALIAAIADAPGLSAEARLRRAIEALHRDTTGRWAGYPRIHEMIEAAMSESWDVCHHHVDRIGAVFERIVHDGVRTGEFEAADPRVAARCVQASILRYTHPLMVSQVLQVPDPSLDQMVDFLLRSLRPARS
jgi:AcrR family transcriptional regulator